MPIALLIERAESGELNRHMGLPGLVLMGIGGTVGAGIFVLTGTAAAQYAGPAIALSFVLAGLACFCAGLCYAELASTIPVAGSAYTYAYATMGEFVAWIIGWNLVLEYLFATSAVAIGWSGYFVAALADLGLPLPAALTTPILMRGTDGGAVASGALFNLPAVGVILLVSWILTRGVKRSTTFNALVVALKLGVILLVITFGASYIDPANWAPFVPANTGTYGEFGWSGVIRGAGVAFFAYIGFDMVSSSAQEVHNPRRNVPLGLFVTLAVVATLYVGVSLVMTGLVPYRELDVANPLFVAIAHAGSALAWLRPLVSIGVVIGLLAVLHLCIYGQTRIFYAMSRDGLLPSVFSRVNGKTRCPVVGTWVVGGTAAALASVTPLQILGEMVAIGTLMAFSIVCIAVPMLRRTDPDLPRSFRVPLATPVALLGTAICLYLMLNLPAATWARFVAWLVIGLLIYVLYGRGRSVVGQRSGQIAPSSAQQ